MRLIEILKVIKFVHWPVLAGMILLNAALGHEFESWCQGCCYGFVFIFSLLLTARSYVSYFKSHNNLHITTCNMYLKAPERKYLLWNGLSSLLSLEHTCSLNEGNQSTLQTKERERRYVDLVQTWLTRPLKVTLSYSKGIQLWPEEVCVLYSSVKQGLCGSCFYWNKISMSQTFLKIDFFQSFVKQQRAINFRNR